MRKKYKIILCIIIILIAAMILLGCVIEEVKTKRAIETDAEINKETIERAIKTIKNTVEIETEKEVDTEEAKEIIEPISLGEFKLTSYCSCSKCCGKWAYNRPKDENGKEIVYGSIGERLKEGYSIAVDPEVIPYGTEVIINGRTYKAQDCGGAIKGNRIDVYHENHQDALNFGVQYAEVFLVK